MNQQKMTSKELLELTESILKNLPSQYHITDHGEFKPNESNRKLIFVTVSSKLKIGPQVSFPGITMVMPSNSSKNMAIQQISSGVKELSKLVGALLS